MICIADKAIKNIRLNTRKTTYNNTERALNFQGSFF
jgi:hypothetical protein